ncbi:MAG: hypothetical protein WBA74_20975 [Cyclobacteriaceae bacterium]
MSKRRKKKKSIVSHQVVARQKANQEKISFFEKLHGITEALEISHLLTGLSKNEKNLLFSVRLRNIRHTYLGNYTLPEEVNQLLLGCIDRELEEEFEFDASGFRFTRRDYLTVFTTLHFWINSQQEKFDFNNPERLRAYTIFQTFFVSNKQILFDFKNALRAIGPILSSPCQYLIEVSMNSRLAQTVQPHAFFQIEIDVRKHEKIQIGYRDQSRTCYPLLKAFSSDHPVTLQITSPTPTDPKNVQRFPVYFQEHAYNRLCERINCVDRGMLVTYMLVSFASDKEQYYIGDTRLVAFNYRGLKLGYFVVKLVKDKFLVKTFLFITADGTPEGNRLRRYLGINKTDKKYLRLDKVSTFLQPVILRDPVLKKAFEKAGCYHLLRLPKKSKHFSLFEKDNLDSTPSTEMIKNYLRMSKVA